MTAQETQQERAVGSGSLFNRPPRVRPVRAIPTTRADLAAYASRLNTEHRWVQLMAPPGEGTERMADVIDDAIALLLALQTIMPEVIDPHQIPVWLRR